QNFSFLSESEKESYVNSVSLYNDMYNTFALKNNAQDPGLVDVVYSNEIYNKGLLFRSSSRVKDIIFESKNNSLIDLYNNWIDSKQQLAILYTTPESERTQSVSKLEESVNNL